MPMEVGMVRKKKTQFVRFKSVNCSALNVRSTPSRDSFSINLLPYGSTVECDKNFKNDDWDHITTGSGIEGFCMKKFLESLDSDDPVILNTNHFKCDGQLCINEESKDDKEI